MAPFPGHNGRVSMRSWQRRAAAFLGRTEPRTPVSWQAAVADACLALTAVLAVLALALAEANVFGTTEFQAGRLPRGGWRIMARFPVEEAPVSAATMAGSAATAAVSAATAAVSAATAAVSAATAAGISPIPAPS
jgi:hypothetical protein